MIAVGGNSLSPKGETGGIHQQFANTRKTLEGTVFPQKVKPAVFISNLQTPEKPWRESVILLIVVITFVSITEMVHRWEMNLCAWI